MLLILLITKFSERFLQNNYGITGTIASLIKSYLSERSVKVLISDKLSDYATLKKEVPPGSIVGPTLLIMYLTPVFDKVEFQLPLLCC